MFLQKKYRFTIKELYLEFYVEKKKLKINKLCNIIC